MSAVHSPLIDMFEGHARTRPNHDAVVMPDGRLTFGELLEEIVTAAQRLRAAGVGPGDRVGLFQRHASLPYLTSALGAMWLGAVCVPINARNKRRELCHVIEHAGIRLILAEEELMGIVAAADPSGSARVVRLGGAPTFEQGAEGVPRDAIQALSDACAGDTLSLLLYTSGTTASPKGCLHTHATLMAQATNCSTRIGLTPEDVFWTPLPLFHVGGWQSFLSTMRRGTTWVHVGMFDADLALRQLEDERCTVAMPAFEVIWMAVLNHPRFAAAKLESLKLVMNVGVTERLELMQAALPHVVQVSMMGMTENAGSLCMGSATDSLESRIHTTGRPLDGTEIRVIDPDTGEDLPRDHPGELVFRGESRFVGYFADPEATARAIDHDGWFHTGDYVIQHGDGTVTFINRIKDMLKVGGENVAAAEIEGYLITHPAVAMAAVVAAPDARYGEVAAAFIQLHPDAELDEQEIIDFCIGQVATYKVPRYVRVVAEFPMTPTAKIQKYVLRDQIAAELAAIGIAQAPKLSTR
jgi:fatty-acyl-CoA synthase